MPIYDALLAGLESLAGG